jgi:hypothetical protein
MSVVCHFLIFLHFYAQIASASEIFWGGEAKKIEIYSDLHGSCSPDCIEFFISEDKIEKLLYEKSTVLC